MHGSISPPSSFCLSFFSSPPLPHFRTCLTRRSWTASHFGTAELFATCAKKDIRVWHTLSNRELLRITVPNMTCHGIDFMRDGKSIISGWDDGKIRAFAPETGRLIYVINNAHRIGVTAIATTSDCKRVISSGGEGEVS
ncbi:cilia- and flagella-associated protein 52-like isoform X2 [Manis javanica]|uniref:cilia- and flagella-associated protein 52-like isoform X2 n=1 Tax=Manis javanica TaxID=9974 RepID=UPI003C6D7C65